VLLVVTVGLWAMCYAANAHAISERVAFERRRHPNVNACCELRLTSCDRYRVRRPNSCAPHYEQPICPGTGDIGGCGRDCDCGHPQKRDCRLCELRRCDGPLNPCGCDCGCGRASDACRRCQRQQCGGPGNPCGCSCGCGRASNTCRQCERRRCAGPRHPCGCDCGCGRETDACQNCKRRQCAGPQRPCGCSCGCANSHARARDSDWQYDTNL
jgi:hypothetical protein